MRFSAAGTLLVQPPKRWSARRQRDSSARSWTTCLDTECGCAAHTVVTYRRVVKDFEFFRSRGIEFWNLCREDVGAYLRFSSATGKQRIDAFTTDN